MFTGFNLRLDKTADIFGDAYEYMRLQIIGKNHLNDQKAIFKEKLKAYVVDDIIDGTKIQDEWFPQIEADIFISHSGNDDELANALAGWIYETFNLSCFIDSNVWGYSKTLLKLMNSELSDERKDTDGGYLYDYESCNQVSQHVNTMLSIALQKMIDKVEAVILLNTDNAVQVCSNAHMEKTYSPWIYSEIICTQFIRKKPLLAYRNYKIENTEHMGIFESMQFVMHTNISYNVSLNHLISVKVEDLIKWKREYLLHGKYYKYALDVFYKFMLPGEVESTQKLFGILERMEIETLQHAYSTSNMNAENWDEIQHVLNGIIRRGLLCCRKCDRFIDTLNE